MKHDPHAKSLRELWGDPKVRSGRNAVAQLVEAQSSAGSSPAGVAGGGNPTGPDQRTSFPTLTDREAEEVRERFA